MKSSSRKRIHDFLAKYADGKYASAGVEFDYESGAYMILIPQSVAAMSERACVMLQNRLTTDLEVLAEVRVLVGETNDLLANAVRKVAPSVLGDLFEDAIVSVSASKSVDLIIIVNDVEEATSSGRIGDLISKTSLLLESMSLSLGDLCFSPLNDDTPNDLQILRKLFTEAPVTLVNLDIALKGAGYAIPSKEWLNRRLDRLTRDKFVLWQEGNEFVLTEKGVSSLPRSTNRNSPDIQRALALARRRWL